MIFYDEQDGEVVAVLPIRRSLAEIQCDGPKERLAQMLAALYELFGFNTFAEMGEACETEYDWVMIDDNKNPDQVWFIVYKLPGEEKAPSDNQKPRVSKPRKGGGISEDDLR